MSICNHLKILIEREILIYYAMLIKKKISHLVIDFSSFVTLMIYVLYSDIIINECTCLPRENFHRQCIMIYIGENFERLICNFKNIVGENNIDAPES